MSIAFTGGANFTGLLLFYHKIMMKNELASGYGAYQLSYAGIGQSGISFSGNQIDLSSNRKHLPTFQNIISNAKYESGANILNSAEISAVMSKISIKGQSPLSLLGSDLLAKTNTALSSPYGIKIINTIYEEDMALKAQKIDKVLTNIHNAAPHSFYNTIFGHGLLFDYENQFHIDMNGKFMKYANNFQGADYLYEHHKDYLYDTRYAKKGFKHDIDRRLENINKAFEEFKNVEDYANFETLENHHDEL